MPYDLLEPEATGYEVLEPDEKPTLPSIPLNPYDAAYLQSGTLDPAGLRDTSFTSAVVSDPVGFAKSLPEAAFSVAGAPGKVAYAGAADVISKIAGQPEYGGNIESMMAGEEQMPASEFIGSVARAGEGLPESQRKDLYQASVAANLAKSLPELASMMAVNPSGAMGKLIAGGFAADMVVKAKPMFEEYAAEKYKAPGEQDAGKLAELEAGILTTFGFAPMAGRHAVSGFRPLDYVPRGAGIGSPEPIRRAGEPYAQTIREDTGQLPKAGQVVEGIEAPRGYDVEQAAPVQPEPVAPRVIERPQAEVLPAEQPQALAPEKVESSPQVQTVESRSSPLAEPTPIVGEQTPAAAPVVETKPAIPETIEPVSETKTGKVETSRSNLPSEREMELISAIDTWRKPAGHPRIYPNADDIGATRKEWLSLTRNGWMDKGWPGVLSMKARFALPERKPTAAESKPELVGIQGATPSTPLLPATTPTVSITPKSQRQIITDLAKGLNVPIRFGRLTTSKYGGYFKKVQNLIGSKRPNDIPTVSHEVGHKLDSLFKLSADKTLRAELDALGDPATTGSMSSWTSSKSLKYKHGEGMAEFLRYWITDPAHAAKAAPSTHAAFESILSANKDMADVLRQAREDVQTWRNAEPQARLRSQISIGDNPNGTRYTLSQLTRDVVDDLHILRLASEEAARNVAGGLDPTKNPYLLARNLRGSYGMAETFVRNGTVDFNTKSVNLGKSLEDALAPVSGRINDFRDWIVAKRAQELRTKGKETGLVDTDVNTTVARFDADPAFQKAFQEVKAWNDSLLQYSVDSGLITPDAAASMRTMNLDYVPFHRLFEVGAGEAPSQSGMGIGSGLNVGKPGSLKRQKGSRRQIVDPLETMVKNAYAVVTASEKAAINRAVAGMADLPNMGKWVERVAPPKQNVRVDLERIRNQLEAAGADLTAVNPNLFLNFFRGGQTPFGENIIRVIRDGEPQYFRLNKDLHDTFKALDLDDAGKLVRILSAPAQLLRAGVVLEPSFNIANALRDTFSAAVINKYGAFPFQTTVKGVAAMLRDPKTVAEWAASGGKSAVEANFFDRTKLQKYLSERITKDLTPAERALIVTKSPLTALRWLTSTVEEATRIGEYRIALDKLQKSGMPEGEARRLAAFEARDRQDFAKGGAKTKIIRHMAAFWNANLQANVKLAQAFKQRPIRTTMQGLAFVTIPKLLEQAVNWNDPDYWDRQQWERDLFFLIPIGKDESGHTRFLRLPTPFEVGVIFGTLPGRFMEWMKQNKPEAVADFPQMMLKQSVPNPIPQTLQVAFEDFLSGEKGWDIWRGRTVVPESLADLPPELQWTDQTSELAKTVGGNLGFSPMKVDHIIERTTGGIGKIASGRQVPGERFVTAPLAVSNQPIQDFYDILGELREQRAAAKSGKGKVPNQMALFEATADRIAKLRNAARVAKDEATKARYQSDMFRLAKQQVERYRKQSP